MLIHLILQLQAWTSIVVLDLLQLSLEAFNLLILILTFFLKLNLVYLEYINFLLLFQEFLLVLRFQFLEALLNLDIAVLKEVIVFFSILKLLILFSQSLLLALVSKDISREDAYARVQAAAMSIWNSDKQFLDAVLESDGITELLSEKEIRDCFDLDRQFVHVDHIFARALKA